MEGNAMKILLIIPPYVLDEAGRGILPHKAMLPVGPLMVAGLLRDRGHEVSVLDLVFEQEWKTKVPDEIPDILLLSCHTPRNIPVCKLLMEHLECRWNGRPYTVLGGNVCLDSGKNDFLKLGLKVDLVVQGFAHYDKLIKAIERKVSGNITAYKLDELPLPALDLIPKATHYRYLEASGDRYPLYGFGIGCAWACNYCTSKMGLKFTDRALHMAVQEMRLAKSQGYKEIWCVDNLIMTNPKICLEFDRELSRCGMNWSGMARVENITALPTGYLKQFSALREIAIGVETATPEILRNLRRGAGGSYHNKIIKAFDQINAARIASNAFVILDLPITGEADFWALWKFLEEADPKSVSWSFYNPPVSAVVNRQIAAHDMGFYRWPFGFSKLPTERVVQQAMILSGTWWDKWTVNRDDPYFESETEIGVNFLEGRFVQEKSARDPAGDIWCAWRKGRRI